MSTYFFIFRTIIQYHIPSGLNAYDNSKTWHEKFTDTYNSICKEYFDVILIQLAAHYHTDDFRLLNDSAVLLNPSLSPVHTNNPAFRKFIVNSSGTLTNFYQYYTDLVFSNLEMVCSF